jgi:LPXTG-motif cell wall-anchored protein
MKIKELTISKFSEIVRRNARLILYSVVVTIALFFLYAVRHSGFYSSQVELEIQLPDASKTARDVEERLSIDSLSKIVADNDLYPKWRGDTRERIVDKFRQDLSIKLLKTDVLRIEYRAQTPQTALSVTNQLVALLTSKRISAENHEVSAKLKNAEAELARQEERLREFNTRFLGSHLQKQTAHFTSLNRLILRLQANMNLLNSLQKEKEHRQQLLRQPQAFDSITKNAFSNRTDSGAALNDSGTKEVNQNLKKEETGLGVDESKQAGAIKGEILKLNRQIDQHTREQEKMQKEMSIYQSRLNSTPQVKRIQNAIGRDYETAKQNYKNLLAKRNELQFEDERSGQLLRMLTSPSFPRKTGEQQMSVLLSLGLVLGLLVGIGLALLRKEKTKPPLSEEEFLSQSGLSVLASIPRICVESSKMNRR